MPRSRVRCRVLLLAMCLSSPLIAACNSASPEQQVLINFFRASRLRDHTILGNFATVSFDPRTDGTVQIFTIVEMSAEHRRGLQIEQLTDQATKLEAARDELIMRQKAYEDANAAALQRIVQAQHAGEPVNGKDADVLASWSTLSQNERESGRQLTQVRATLASERAAAVDSLTPPGEPDVDVSTRDVEMIWRDITINADVRTPDGRTTPTTLVITLQRAIGTQGAERSGRWIVVGLKPGRTHEKTE